MTIRRSLRASLRRVGSATAVGLSVCASAWAAFAITGLGEPEPKPAVLPTLRERVFVDRIDIDAFHKGNLHAHSAESDGDVPPADVYRWYRDHGYAFVALTDHNRRIDPASYAHLERPTFAILPGEEITMTGAGKPVHVNAICHRRKIGGGTFDTKSLALTFALEKIEEQGAIALVNHPNFDRALDLDDLWGARATTLLEIWSGHPYVYSAGVDGRPSHEELWASMLSRGADVFGVAVDDSHHFATNPTAKPARPGRAWIATFASTPDKVTRDGVCNAIRAGQFYASSGAELTRIAVAERTITIRPADPMARVEFIGPGSTVLSASNAAGEGAVYRMRGDEEWVRARIVDSRGEIAWTQPFRTMVREAAPVP
ncbi:MAG: CehA/McbA family metallohydrolase [Polyangiaceae bacterium]|nr:CehA/McbA family metallohydrolase [Polyangiaceae bacterium]